MKRFRKTAVAVAGAVLVVGPVASASAGGGGGGGDDAVTTIAGGLDGPRQLSEYPGDRLLVAESDSGEVSAITQSTGAVETLLSGLYSPQGVDHAHGLLYVAVGGPPPPEEGAPPPPPGAAFASLLVAEPGGGVLQTIDLEAYELANNPDGQVQFVDGVPVDALSNPFAVLAQRDRVLVADAGANTVLSVDPHSGEVSTFFVPPVVTPDEVAACGEFPNNPGTVGCDPVPTGIAEGPHGLLYVSTLGAEVPGASRVYVLDYDGDVVDVIEGLTSATGVAVDSHGTVYVSDVIEGAPMGEGPPPAGFDPASVGEITRIGTDGARSTSQVTMPTGLVIEDGELYASAWSIASFLGIPGAGEVVRVGEGTFTG
jgi:hypothetical protein